jgi:hypothetical protein
MTERTEVFCREVMFPYEICRMTRSFLYGVFHKSLVSVILYNAQKFCASHTHLTLNLTLGKRDKQNKVPVRDGCVKPECRLDLRSGSFPFSLSVEREERGPLDCLK